MALGAGCSDTSASSDGPAITGLFWVDGADSEQPLTVSKTIDLPKSAKAIQESDYTVVAQPELSAVGAMGTPVGEGFVLTIEHKTEESLDGAEGSIARAVLVRDGQEIVLYAGTGGADNLEAVVKGDRVAWVELSDSDSAATWDWSVKSMKLGDSEPTIIATATDLNSRDDVPVVLQFMNLTIDNNTVYWAPVYQDNGTLVQAVFSRPADASAPAGTLINNANLVLGDTSDLFAQQIEDLAIDSANVKETTVYQLDGDAAEGIINNTVNAELLGNAGKELLIAVDDLFYLANTQSKKVTAITGVSSTSNDVSVCGTRIYFQDPKTNEGEMGTHYVLNAEDGSVVSVTSPLAISCSGDSALWIPEHEPTESVLVNWKK